MKILIVNDDGPTALTTALSTTLAEGHQVWTCLPSTDRSGSGGSISVGGPVLIAFEDEGRTMLVQGTPSDCVHVAMFLMEQDGYRPDLVLSGINNGWNPKGCSAISGTIGAATVAKLAYGIPAMAISVERNVDGYSVEQCQAFAQEACRILALMADEMVKERTCLNLNMLPLGQFPSDKLHAPRPAQGLPKIRQDRIGDLPPYYAYDWDSYWAIPNEVTTAIAHGAHSLQDL